MPEGPTIRTAADALRAALQGQPLVEVSSRFRKAAAEDWAGKLTGQRVSEVRAHGKNLFIHVANGWVIYSHMLMWGAWHVYERGQPWAKEASKARLVLGTPHHCVVLFSAPICELIAAADLPSHPTSALGPDLLAAEVGPAERATIRRRLQARGATELGAALMDQTVMAGIGNILKSEILFAAGLHPQRRADSLDAAEFDRMIDLAVALMQRSYATGGFEEAFLSPALRQATGKLGYVYRRSQQPCLRCGTRIRMVRQGHGDRMTFFCPVCQPLDPAAAPEPEPRVTTPWTDSVRTIEQARDFVLAAGMVGILDAPRARAAVPTLWDAVAFPAKQAGEAGWGEKMSKVWGWKNELPERFPTQIFYGKIKGGRAVLMSMERLREHYAAHHTPLDQCSPLAQELFAAIAQGPIMTVPLRQLLGYAERARRAAFDRALQELQVTLNIARSNQPGVAGDTWVPFATQYPQLSAAQARPRRGRPSS